MRTVFWPARWRSMRKCWSAKSRWAKRRLPRLGDAEILEHVLEDPLEAEHRSW